jgi:hypothetical protein
MKEDTIIDYAMPLMKVERFAKEIHDLCLDGRYGEAQTRVALLLAEARILQTTLKHMKEQHDR